ncbi:hypothetical protein G9A89_015888 [Geosiphon pyriformis]|nr:hypothetical protein G9A89_015888 [Geosiphon pyriformis]
MDLHGPVPKWFNLSVVFFEASHFSLLVSAGAGPLDICGFNNFVSIYDCLSQVGTNSLFVYMDGSLKNLDMVGCRARAAAFFEDINLGLGIGVYGLLLSTLTELQAIALALKCMPAAHSVHLFLVLPERAKRQCQILTTALISSEKKAHIYRKYCNRQKTNSVPYNKRTQWNYAEDILSIIESTKHYHFPYPPSLPVTFGASCEVINLQRQSTPEIHKSDLGIPAEITIAENDFCNYITTKINCLLGHTTDTRRLGKQIHQSLLRYLTTTTTQVIAETLCIVNMDIKHYEYEYGSNNPTTAQDKSMVNKKPRIFSPITPSYHQTSQIGNTTNFWKLTSLESTKLEQITERIQIAPPAQNPTELASLLMEGTAILQPIGSTTTKFKVATIPDTATLEYYQSIYTHCKQKFNIPDGIEIVKRTLYLYIKNRINNYFLRNYNISEVRSNLYNNLVHYSRLGTKNLNSKTLVTYFQELNYNIINNKGKQKAKQHSKTTSNTPILTKTTAKHLQTPEQRTKDFQSPKSPIQQQKPILTSTNLIDYLAENRSEETKSEQETEDSENKKEIASTYIAKIPEFTEEDSKTSPQKWLDKVSKAEDANGWNTARMLKAIPYFLQGMAGKWFENLEAPPEYWEAFKTAFLEQFTDNNTSIILQNQFRNIKQEPSKSVMTYFGKFNKLLRKICQLETNEYYSNAQILDQFIAGLKDKLIKKVCLHAPENLATAIQQAKNYEMAMKKANHTKLVNLAIGETSSAAEKKIDQLTKKVENYFINQQQQQQLQQSQQPQRY